jgi:hypothetical protein
MKFSAARSGLEEWICMYKAATVLMLLLFTSTLAGASGTVYTDGKWWRSLPDSERLDVMSAAASAYYAGYFVGFDKGFNMELRIQTEGVIAANFSASQENRYHAAVEKGNLDENYPDFSGKTIKAYSDGVSKFYSNHPGSDSIDIGKVLQCLQDNPQISCDILAKREIRMNKVFKSLPH